MANANEQFLVPEKLNIKSLNVTASFNGLTDKDKNYAHNMSRASWSAAPIVSKQISPESYYLVSYFIKLFRKYSTQGVQILLSSQFTSDCVGSFLNFVAMLLGDNGNYNNFGDRKFIPRLPQETFKKMLQVLDNTSNLDKLLQTIYNLADNVKLLNYYPKGVTTYYSSNMTEEEVTVINEYMTSQHMEHWNTRITKQEVANAKPVFIIHVASVTIRPDNKIAIFKNLTITTMYGDYTDELKKVNNWLTRAAQYTRNDEQKQMLASYVEHFTSGDIEKHKESQKHWIKDTEPPVETNIGFIETYRDPSGVRAEFESFVAVVDVETSKRFKKMVDAAPELVATLPWGPAFEKDVFHKPDFTSLEIITFVSSGIPAGINIPNYNEIRQNIGFKNVSLGNVIKASYTSTDPVDFLLPEDDKVYRDNVQQSFECDVAGHELLGHGSGKLLYEMKDGTFNFNKETTINPFTGKPVTTWYKEGETYGSKFGKLAGAVEESRAEACGMFFSVNKVVQEIFEHGDKSSDIMYVSWLWMIRAGLTSLAAGYDADQKRWLQSHAHARNVIYRVMSEVKGFVTVKLNNEGTDFTISIDKAMILGEGMAKLKDYMTRLQVYRATGDFEGCSKWFGDYSNVDDYHLKLREIMITKSKPRPLWIQPKTYMEGTVVRIKEYPTSTEGLITSICENYVLTEEN